MLGAISCSLRVCVKVVCYFRLLCAFTVSTEILLTCNSKTVLHCVNRVSSRPNMYWEKLCLDSISKFHITQCTKEFWLSLQRNLVKYPNHLVQTEIFCTFIV